MDNRNESDAEMRDTGGIRTEALTDAKCKRSLRSLRKSLWIIGAVCSVLFVFAVIFTVFI